MKKPVIRKCVVTGERLEKKLLTRIVKDNEGNVVIDLTGKKNGRGVYIKLEVEVIQKAKVKRILERELEVKNLASIYEDLEKIIAKETVINDK